MRTLMSILLLMLLMPGCAEQAVEQAAAESVVLQVEGMTCGSCEKSIESTLSKIPGVQSVEASFKEKSAVVKLEAGKTTPAQLATAVNKLGYTATLQDTTVTP